MAWRSAQLFSRGSPGGQSPRILPSLVRTNLGSDERSGRAGGCRWSGRAGNHARLAGSRARPRGRPHRARDRGARRLRAQLRPGLGQRPRGRRRAGHRAARPRAVGADRRTRPRARLPAHRLADPAAHRRRTRRRRGSVARDGRRRARLPAARRRTRPAPSTPPCAASPAGALLVRAGRAPSSPRTAQPALRGRTCWQSGRYTFLPRPGGARGRSAGTPSATTTARCTPATSSSSAPGLARRAGPRAGPELPVRRVRLQMMQTAPLGRAAHHLGRRRRQLPLLPGLRTRRARRAQAGQPQAPAAAAHKMQLLMVQRRTAG